MNIGVEVLKESVIRVQSQLNDWMDCGMVDAEVADAIIQYALFGEIIYG